jgi:hypothetical protein
MKLRLIWLFFFTLVIISSASAQMIVFSPTDKTITNRNIVSVEGKVFDQRLTRVLIGPITVPVDQTAHFVGAANLQFGKNKLRLVALDQKGREKAEVELKILCLRTYKDVRDDYWSKPAIEQLATLAILKGDAEGNFRPNNSITRAELMVIMSRLSPEGEKVPLATRFTDLTPSHWAYESIMPAVAAGLIAGYPDGTFRPDQTITRLEALAIIVRFAGLLELGEAKSYYEDLPVDNWGYKYVMAARQAGWLNYIKTSYLGPFDNLSRGEAAGILAQTKYGVTLIDRLLDFSTGY